MIGSDLIKMSDNTTYTEFNTWINEILSSPKKRENIILGQGILKLLHGNPGIRLIQGQNLGEKGPKNMDRPGGKGRGA